MRDLLEAMVEHGAYHEADFIEARYQKRLRSFMSVRKGEMDRASSGIWEGFGIRVLVSGSWGFSSTSSPKRGDLMRKVEEAIKLAKSSAPAKRVRAQLADVRAVEGEAKAEMRDDLRDHSLEEKIKLVIEADKRAREYSKEMASTTVRYDENIIDKYYMNSDGSYYHIFDAKPEFIIAVIARRGEVMTESIEGICETKGWEVFRERDPIEATEKACERAIKLLDAEKAPSEVKAVILDSSLVGLLSHEAIGHTVEADFVIAGSAASGKIGQRVANELITLVDDGTIPWSAGWLPFDDEGVAGRKTVIIDRGVLKGYLHSRETASRLNFEPTGNSRAWSYRDVPLIRMRATYIEAGDWSREEIIEDTKDGLLLSGARGGQADSNAEFMFGVQEAFRIKNGSVEEPYRGVTISGNAYDVLMSVDAVGEDFKLEMGWGYCGKLQPAKVDGGGPSIRCKVLVGSR